MAHFCHNFCEIFCEFVCSFHISGGNNFPGSIYRVSESRLTGKCQHHLHFILGKSRQNSSRKTFCRVSQRDDSGSSHSFCLSKLSEAEGRGEACESYFRPRVKMAHKKLLANFPIFGTSSKFSKNNIQRNVQKRSINISKSPKG